MKVKEKSKIMEWVRVCSILHKASTAGCDAIIPKDCVSELYVTLSKLAEKERFKACKKVYDHINKLGKESLWVLFEPTSGTITIRILPGFRNKTIIKLYKYLNQYYEYTEDIDVHTDNLRLYLQVEGSPVYVTFESYAYKEVAQVYKDNVKAWSVSHNVGKAIRSDSDIIVWNIFRMVTADPDPFMIGLSDQVF